MKKKQLQIWFTEDDERDFSESVLSALPGVSFLDDNVWEGDPVVRGSIADCESRFVYLWDRDRTPRLPVFERGDGQCEGPISGVVIQFVRSRFDGDRLVSGRIAAGYDASEERMVELVSVVWKAARRISGKADSVNPITGDVIASRVKDLLVGRDAASRFGKVGLTALKYNSTENYYMPTR